MLIKTKKKKKKERLHDFKSSNPDQKKKNIYSFSFSSFIFFARAS